MAACGLNTRDTAERSCFKGKKNRNRFCDFSIGVPLRVVLCHRTGSLQRLIVRNALYVHCWRHTHAKSHTYPHTPAHTDRYIHIHTHTYTHTCMHYILHILYTTHTTYTHIKNNTHTHTKSRAKCHNLSRIQSPLAICHRWAAPATHTHTHSHAQSTESKKFRGRIQCRDGLVGCDLWSFKKKVKKKKIKAKGTKKIQMSACKLSPLDGFSSLYPPIPPPPPQVSACKLSRLAGQSVSLPPQTHRHKTQTRNAW